MIPTFTVNAASEILEHDRRTVTKAVRHIEPDKVERGQKRYKLRTILDALDQLPGSSGAPRRHTTHTTGWKDERIVSAYHSVNEMYGELAAIDDLEQRRAVAKKKWGPVIQSNNINLRLWNVENGHSEELAEHRSEGLWHMSINFVRRLCEWSDEEAHDLLVTPHDGTDKEEAAEYRANREAARARLLSKLTAQEKTTLKNLLHKVGVNPYYFPPEIPLSMWGNEGNADDL
jgi:hypothetical protein